MTIEHPWMSVGEWSSKILTLPRKKLWGKFEAALISIPHFSFIPQNLRYKNKGNTPKIFVLLLHFPTTANFTV